MNRLVNKMTILAFAGVLSLTSCASSDDTTQDDSRLSIVTTNFAGYDFARAIVGDSADVTMLLKPGAESHTYEPTPQDMITIQDSDIFIYAGGDSDSWVEDVLDSMDRDSMSIFKMMDTVELIEEEEEEGFYSDIDEHEGEEDEAHEHEENDEEPDHDHEEESSTHTHSHEDGEVEMDEHVWTSPVNAIIIVESLRDSIVSLDNENEDIYVSNADSYIQELEELDREIRDMVSSSERQEIIVADRFPFGYFVKEYGLTYYAAFPGCSTDTQPSAKIISFLIDKVKDDEIPVVFHIELSNEEMCDAISADTGAKKELLYAIHNVTDQEFKEGVTYIDLMKHNIEVLKEALN